MTSSLAGLSAAVGRSGTPESGVAQALATATGSIRVIDSGKADCATRATEMRGAGSGATRTWRSSAHLIGALDESLGDSADDILLSYRLHALLRVDEALATLAGLYGMAVEAERTTPDLVERRARVSRGHVRRRFPAA